MNIFIKGMNFLFVPMLLVDGVVENKDRDILIKEDKEKSATYFESKNHYHHRFGY